MPSVQLTLRDAWAVAVLGTLADRHNLPDLGTHAGVRAMATLLKVPASEVRRALVHTSIKTLALWAAQHRLCVLQDGTTVTVIEQRSSQ